MQATTSTSTVKLPQRKIGNDNVPAIGLGLMGMAVFVDPNEDAQEVEKQHMEVLTRAADAGETFWDTSDFYGPFKNEEMIGRWFKLTGRRKEIFLATKFGITFDPETKKPKVRGDRDHIRQAIEGSLKRLGTDYVDLYYQHRVDQNTRIEDTVSAMAELVKEGKVRHLGLSECSANTLRRAHKVHPIAALQVEYSLFYLDIEKEQLGLKKACDELGITVVAYSPLGRGILTGQYTSFKDIKQTDPRLRFARFQEENFDQNLEVFRKISAIAEKKGVTPSQLALAWILTQGDNIVPIPGTRRVKYLEENLASVKIELSPEEIQELRQIGESTQAKGERYPGPPLSYLDTI